MFKKFASNILQELADSCIKKSVLCKSAEDKELYEKIAKKTEAVIQKLDIEKSSPR